MSGRVIVDGRNMIDTATAAAAGFSLVPLGRPANWVDAAAAV